MDKLGEEFFACASRTEDKNRRIGRSQRRCLLQRGNHFRVVSHQFNLGKSLLNVWRCGVRSRDRGVSHSDFWELGLIEVNFGYGGPFGGHETRRADVQNARWKLA